MKVELFGFQQIAKSSLRSNCAQAIHNYSLTTVPQVVSFTAPTGSGKTIIMASLIESIFCGDNRYEAHPESIFIWLSDSPQLNEQSRLKLELKADKLPSNCCVSISEETFDQEFLDDGHVYFLNTQKLGKASNLTKHGDKRQFTIWETLTNTVNAKSDRLYVIIDEAHRGMQGRNSKEAVTIMQKFLKGSKTDNLPFMPVVVGMSATPERFNTLIKGTPATIYQTIVDADAVRSSGLLKDRIVITYPDEGTTNKDMGILEAATDNWIDKRKHWNQYCTEQHYRQVDPVFVVQVLKGKGKNISETDLNDCLSKIEVRSGTNFKPGEVVHTFGQTDGSINVNGLDVQYVEPSAIANDHAIKVVFFKENLSTGWDCPRAETMMSFRHAEDATYIAQLLGRMIRTPMQSRIKVDETLNDVHLFLPHFNEETVQEVIEELQSSEGGNIPTDIESETPSTKPVVTWTIHSKKSENKTSEKEEKAAPAQEESKDSHTENTSTATDKPVVNSTVESNTSEKEKEEKAAPIQEDSKRSQTENASTTADKPVVNSTVEGNTSSTQEQTEEEVSPVANTKTTSDSNESMSPAEPKAEELASDTKNVSPDNTGADSVSTHPVSETQQSTTGVTVDQKEKNGDLFSNKTETSTVEKNEQIFDREAVVRFINTAGLLTYEIRQVRITNYLTSLLQLARLLSQQKFDPDAFSRVKGEIASRIKANTDELKKQGLYDGLCEKLKQFKLSSQTFDAFGINVDEKHQIQTSFMSTDTDIDRQFNFVDDQLGSEGIGNFYGSKYIDEDNPEEYKLAVILFAQDPACISSLHSWAKEEFHSLNDANRLKFASVSEDIAKKYDRLVSDSDTVSKHNFTLPESIRVPTDPDGTDYSTHLFVDPETGFAKIKLNAWEADLIREEEKRPDFICWLRNPPRKSWSLCLKYMEGTKVKKMFPDFLVVRQSEDGKMIIDILEPHNPNFEDNLPKAQGLADYAKKNPFWGRIQLIRKQDVSGLGKQFVRLDLCNGLAREHVLNAASSDELDNIFKDYGFTDLQNNS